MITREDIEIIREVAPHIAAAGLARSESEAICLSIRGHSLGLDPVASCEQIKITPPRNGQAAQCTIGVHAQLAAARRAIPTLVVEIDDQPTCCTVTMRRGEEVYRTVYDDARAKQAGLNQRDTWKRHGAQMRRAAALREALRVIAPDAIGGAIYEPGEIDATSDEPIEPVVTPPRKPLPAPPSSNVPLQRQISHPVEAGPMPQGAPTVTQQLPTITGNLEAAKPLPVVVSQTADSIWLNKAIRRANGLQGAAGPDDPISVEMALALWDASTGNPAAIEAVMGLPVELAHAVVVIGSPEFDEYRAEAADPLMVAALRKWKAGLGLSAQLADNAIDLAQAFMGGALPTPITVDGCRVMAAAYWLTARNVSGCTYRDMLEQIKVPHEG